jgi:hypothetical protein
VLHSSYRHGVIYSDVYAVKERLLGLHLTVDLVAEAVKRGDTERASAPVFGYEGHPEYNAGSRALSTICELGGQTDGAWKRDNYLKIPVAISSDHRVAIHATAGSEGTGQVDGDPRNKSLKGPYSTVASKAQQSLIPDEPAPLFFWLFTRRDPFGLWAELFAPVMDDSGYAIGYTERVLLPNLDSDGGARRQLPEAAPTPIVNVPRKAAS